MYRSEIDKAQGGCEFSVLCWAKFLTPMDSHVVLNINSTLKTRIHTFSLSVV
jgi:hypothetical protein